MVCGAVFELRSLGGGEGEYVTACGDEPTECAQDTAMVHGPGHGGGGPAGSSCNCLSCDS